MLPQTQQHLDDLKAAGFDVSSLEAQVKNPILEKQADRLIGGGILRQAEFSKYMTKTTEEKEQLEKQVRELAALHDSAKSLEGNDEVYKAALEIIDEREKLLINAGYDEEEVKNLSLLSKQQLEAKAKTPPNKVDDPPTKKEKELVMTQEIDTSKFIDLETYQAGAANQIYGSVALNAKVQAAMLKAQKLGIELNEQNINSIAETIRTTVERGGNIDEAIDTNFGIKAREAVLAEENQKKAIEDARAEGRAEAFKEAGVPKRMVSSTPHPLSKLSHIVPEQKEELTLENVPKNSKGEAEVYRLRNPTRDRESRIANATNHLETVSQREMVAAE